MRIRTLLIAIAGTFVMWIAGCGGGGGGGGTAPTVISGVSSKGPVNGGAVSVYAIANGQVDRSVSLGPPVSTKEDGSYSITLNSAPAGPVLVEVIGGQFKDETTGTSTNKLFPLRAVVDKTTAGTNNVAVSGLTEIAVQKIEGSGGTFNAANPADVNTGGSAGDKDYGLALASLMQYVKNNNKSLDPNSADNVFSEFGKLLNGKLDPNSQVNNDTATQAIIARYQESRNTFLADTVHNQSGLSGITNFTVATIKVSTQGTLPLGIKLNGVEFTLSLPDGVTIDADANGIVDTTAANAPVQVSGVAKTAGVTFLAGGVKFTPKTASAPNMLKLVLVSGSATSFDLGEFVTISSTIAPNSRILGSSFIITGTKAVTVGTDTNSIGAKVPGVSMVPIVSLR